ncbi:hypothetical protein GCM10009853_045200 [Glycomyces scopariae]|uniref:Uncharacterized protein n=1 Tax=Glycomyces sambucus TaxID=380244 RepID=A0A1G9DKJ5_9ACTN|nr:hypothetical protein [Glycomyces sambucus]SDK64275.1 hypothetical protein SAMN05216298_0947 [Glycomyces sambucus]
MPSAEGPRTIRVGYSRKASVLTIGLGFVLAACAAVTVFTPFIPVLVPIGLTGLALLGGGLRSFFRPRYLYSPETGVLTVFMVFGPGSEGTPGPEGERVYSDGRRVYRESPDGERHRVSFTGTDRADMARLLQALPQGRGPAITGPGDRP